MSRKPEYGEDFYFDDPTEYQEAPRSYFRIFSALLLVAGTFLGTTYAPNISLGISSAKEFGQGLLGVQSCSGSSAITVTPSATYTNASGSGSYKVSSLEVSNVPAGCDGSDFTILVFDSSTSTSKSLHSTDSNTVLVGYRSGVFGAPSGQTGFTVSNPRSGAFKVTFTTPILVANDANVFTIQSAKGTISIALSCAQGGSCSLGQTGPGGGVVFAYVSAGFNCGPNYTSSGSPTGGRCKYLEVAPRGWYGSADDPALIWADSAYQSTTLSGTASANGAGYKNSVLILNQGNGATTAAGASRAYSGGGLNDWYLPSQSEMITLINYGTSGSYSAAAPGFGLLRAGGYGGYYSTSSQHDLAGYLWIYGIVNGGGGVEKFRTLNVRPIRAF